MARRSHNKSMKKSAVRERRNRRNRRDRRRRTMKGAGWSDAPPAYHGQINMLYAGGQEHRAYGGEGKDCPGTPIPAGSWIDPALYSGARGGLPGLAMSGGRYDGLGSAATWPFGQNGVGAAFGQVEKTACEPTDPRTPGGMDYFNGIKAASMGANNMALGTAVKAFPPPYPAGGVGPGASQSGGGGYQYANPAPAGLTAGQQNSPPQGIENVYHVGDTTTAAYYAPTAGYANLPMPNPPAANPAILVQNHYDAKSYNQACVGPTHGGARKTRKVSKVLRRILRKIRGSKSNTKEKFGSNPLPPPNATKKNKKRRSN